MNATAWKGAQAYALVMNPEGNHLPGYGVVYSVTLPPRDRMNAAGKVVLPQHFLASCISCHSAAPSKETAKPTTSSWEEARLQLQGNRPKEAPKNPQPPKPATADIEVCDPSLELSTMAGAILRLWADQGKNMAQLAEHERLTLAVTFRGDIVAGGWSYSTYGATTGSAAPVTSELPVLQQYYSNLGREDVNQRFLGPWLANTPSTTGATAGQQVHTAAGSATLAPSDSAPPWNQYILLGDLHLRQKQYDQAADNYRKAIAMIQGGSADIHQTREEAYRKLAEVYLAQDQLDNAREALDMASKWKAERTKAAKALANTPFKTTDSAAPATAASPLPPKLVISVTKRMLDDVGGGRMTFDEFKKQATVEYVNFPPAK